MQHLRKEMFFQWSSSFTPNKSLGKKQINLLPYIQTATKKAGQYFQSWNIPLLCCPEAVNLILKAFPSYRKQENQIQRFHRIREGWGWKGPLDFIWSKPLFITVKRCFPMFTQNLLCSTLGLLPPPCLATRHSWKEPGSVFPCTYLHLLVTFPSFLTHWCTRLYIWPDLEKSNIVLVLGIPKKNLDKTISASRFGSRLTCQMEESP